MSQSQKLQQVKAYLKVKADNFKQQYYNTSWIPSVNPFPSANTLAEPETTYNHYRAELDKLNDLERNAANFRPQYYNLRQTPQRTIYADPANFYNHYEAELRNMVNQYHSQISAESERKQFYELPHRFLFIVTKQNSQKKHWFARTPYMKRNELTWGKRLIGV